MMIRRPFPARPSQPGALFERLHRSTVLWSWIFNGLRLASGLVLLPLVLRKLSTEELGMYYVLLTQVALGPVIDFGFSPTVLRFVSYAMGGAETLQAHGVTPSAAGGPNYRLLWRLFFATRALYRILALLVLVLLGAWGTYIVGLRIHEVPSPGTAWLAWLITLAATALDVYSSWAPVFLRGMDDVLVSVRIGVLACAVRFVLAAGLLMGGAGLMSLPLGGLVGGLLQQVVARRRCLRLLQGQPAPEYATVWPTLRVLWPNSWRVGLQTLSNYLTVNTNTMICLSVLGLAANAQYGLSIQILGFIASMAAVWLQVKWQVIGQYRARHDYLAIRRVLWPRFWLLYLSFLVMAAGLLLCGQTSLRWLGSEKQMLPPLWLGLLALNSFLEAQVSAWGVLITTENRIPFLWPSVVANVAGLALTLTLIHTTSLGLRTFVLVPLFIQCLFNYWYWPLYGARTIGTTWAQFTFSRPEVSRSASASEPVAAS